jgi:hypothetical protein
MKLVIEQNGIILHGPGRWKDLDVYVGLRGNAIPSLPYETEFGVIRRYKESREILGQYQTHGEPTESVDESGDWVKTWSAEDRPVEDCRQIASLSRKDFALVSLAQGWITEQEAVSWAAGQSIPSWVEDIIDQNIPSADRAEIKIQTLTDPVVKRTGTLMPMLQAVKSVSDAELDAVFGIV